MAVRHTIAEQWAWSTETEKAFDAIQAAALQRLFVCIDEQGIQQASLCAAVGGLGYVAGQFGIR